MNLITSQHPALSASIANETLERIQAIAASEGVSMRIGKEYGLGFRV